MKIGNLELKGYAALAPMAGVADMAFRVLCHEYGACYSVSEMVSSKGISYKSEKSEKLMELSDLERPSAIQIFGDEPSTLSLAAKVALKYNPEVIDINMGCPAPKINSSGGGSSLMRNPILCGEIVKAVVETVDVPVTVKIRKGYDDTQINAVEVAKICEENGASAITVHGRTKMQYYKGKCDLDIIKNVKSAVSIPVIGNGDIFTYKDAKYMYEYTNCDLVMVGRGALGNPWIFKEINDYFENGIVDEKVDLDERLSIMIRHIESMVENKGEYIGMREARKHVSYYLKGFKNAASIRKDAFSMNTIDDLYKLVDTVKKYNE